jgi:CheY-like chemotaxis protein
MELMCEDCRAIIQVSDARVPSNSTFRLTCPRCKKKIVVSAKAPEIQEGGSKIAGSTAVGFTEVAPPTCNSLKEEFAEEMGSLPPGQSTALLCLDRDDAREVLQAVLQGMGYVVDMPMAVDQALQRLRFNQYHIIVLAEDFRGSSPNPIAAYLAWLSMNIRRDMFVVLVGERFKTADHLQAFIESVNLVLHPDDLPRIETFINQGLKDHERLYKVFVDCLIEAGKKL